MKHLLFFILLCCAVMLPYRGMAADPTPFGSNLFQGNFSKAQDNMVLLPGDRVILRLWGGSLQLDDTLVVDGNGNLTLPELGTIPVSGLVHDKLVDSIKSKLAAAGHADTQIYVAPLDSRPIAVFVTGTIQKPGRYSGAPLDPVLSFLDKAGGIDPTRGSYRDIRLIRDGQEVEKFDLYPFARRGTLPLTRLHDGDTLVVGERGPCVTVTGAVRVPARFEFLPNQSTGAKLIELADPEPNATHATLQGIRDGIPYSTYLPINELRRMVLEDGDSIQFLADSTGNTILISVEGAVRGASRFPVRRGSRLKDVLMYISVDPVQANLSAMYLKRPSVAVNQKKAIEASLRRLEETALTTSSNSSEEAQLRSKEAEMISKFVERAKTVEPEGIVVLEEDGHTADLTMEDGDVIVIPEKTDVVLVSGEVLVPRALVWSKGKKLKDYVEGAGGYSNRADKDNVLIMRQNGAIAHADSEILPGDQLMVMPYIQSKAMQVVKDISTVLSQVAVSTRMVLGLPSL